MAIQLSQQSQSLKYKQRLKVISKNKYKHVGETYYHYKSIEKINTKLYNIMRISQVAIFTIIRTLAVFYYSYSCWHVRVYLHIWLYPVSCLKAGKYKLPVILTILTNTRQVAGTQDMTCTPSTVSHSHGPRHQVQFQFSLKVPSTQLKLHQPVQIQNPQYPFQSQGSQHPVQGHSPK